MMVFGLSLLDPRSWMVLGCILGIAVHALGRWMDHRAMVLEALKSTTDGIDFVLGGGFWDALELRLQPLAGHCRNLGAKLLGVSALLLWMAWWVE